jgi:hypothetical protein
MSLPSDLTTDRVNFWLSAGYTDLVVYSKRVAEDFNPVCYFATCGSPEKINKTKTDLENQGMTDVRVLSLRSLGSIERSTSDYFSG